MKKALVFMANGFEEIEAITLVDILRRAEIHVDMCSIHEEREVTGSHGIRVRADLCLAELSSPELYAAVITPGGMPGSSHLRDDERVIEIIRFFFERKDKLIASICAAPIVLAKAGITPNLAGTCYPGFESEVGYAEYRKQAVCVHENVLTSMGAGTAFVLGLKLVEALAGKEKAEQLYEQTMLGYTGAVW